MASLNPKLDLIRCPIRKRHVQSTSEERVRCALLSMMIEERGYPPSLIVVERKVTELLGSFQPKGEVPNRRVDILCYLPTLTPLLLIECKAVALSAKAMAQVLSYNHYIGAHFVAIANSTELRVVPASPWAEACMQSNPALFENYLPSYNTFVLQK
ncbi:MAG: type I restriction enzyme HsdR N-terminal domain-containing protein [Verrucomicrobia bacterium]|nr:type I restriction enzyme HsdR N-terminal domain-containing protein [Verrucomicrobiota bacterium]